MDFTSRYGSSLPDPATMCHAECEGTGWVPIHRDDMEEPWHTLWQEAEAQAPTDDGYHFVRCPTCNGTGKQPA